MNEELSQQGLRVLAFGKRMLTAPAIGLEDENDLQFLGLIAMMDPPREESKAAVGECIAAGIRPIMITGDHKVTASRHRQGDRHPHPPAPRPWRVPLLSP